MLALIYIPLFILAGIIQEGRPMWIVDIYAPDGAAIAQHFFGSKIESLQFLTSCGAAIGNASAPYYRSDSDGLAKVVASEAAWTEIDGHRTRFLFPP